MNKNQAFDAIESGDIARLMMALMRGTSVNARDEKGRTLLLAACEHPLDRHGFVQHLLSSGALPTLSGPDGQTPLHALAQKNAVNFATVEALIDADVALNHKDERGRTPLHAMAERGWIDGCTLILNASVRPHELINERDGDGKTPLQLASENSDHGALVCTLISYGADPRIVDHEGIGPAQLVTDAQARMLVLMQIKVLCKADAAREQSALQEDSELQDLMSQSKAILAKSYLRQGLAFLSPETMDSPSKNPQP